MTLLALGCSSPDASGTARDAGDGTDLNSCERARLGAALGVTELSLPLDPIDEPLADIARDICALDSSDPGSTAPADTRVLSPSEQRDAALPAALVRAPALFDPDDPPPGADPVLDELWESCGAGSASACNALLYEATPGSEYEAYAFSCGGRENLHCSVLLGDGSEGGLLAVDFEPQTPAPGNIAELDGWWESCGDGSSRACAQLVLSRAGRFGVRNVRMGLWRPPPRSTAHRCWVTTVRRPCSADALRTTSHRAQMSTSTDCGSDAERSAHQRAATSQPLVRQEATTSVSPCRAAGAR